VAAAGEDEFVRLYNLHTGQLLDEKALHHDWVRSVAFAPSSPTLASGSGDGTVRVWQVTECRLRPLRRIDVGEDRVRAVAATDHAEMVIAAGEEATLQAFTADGPAGQITMPPGIDWVRTIALTREGVAAGCEDGGLRLWRPSRDSQPATLAEGANTIWSATFADNGQVIATGHGDGAIQLYDPRTMVVRRRISAGPGRVWSLAAGGEYVAAACGDGGIRVWSLADATFATHVNVGVRRSWAVAVAPFGGLLAASDNTGHVRIWQLPSGKLLWEQDAKAGRVRSLAFDGNANLLAAAGGDGVVRLWQATTGQPLSDDLNVSGWARTVALDGTGARLAVGTGTGDIHVHHLGSGQLSVHLSGHDGRVLMLGFTNDADQLVSAAADGTARQWSVSRQEQIAQIRVDAAGQCAAFDAIHGGVLVGSAAGLAALTIHNPPGAA
jgi:WD40 repeat protein